MELKKLEQERDQAVEEARVQRDRFRYSEPPTDRDARSLADQEQIVGRYIKQDHDGSFQPNTDDLNYQPVTLPTVTVYDPAAEVFEKDASNPKYLQEDVGVQHEHEDSERVDFE